MTEYIPYTYLIGWTSKNIWYYGSEYKCSKKQKAHPDNLWKTYFTSSSTVKGLRNSLGEPDVVQVRRTFKDSESCLAWETKVLRRMRVINSDNWINQTNNRCFSIEACKKNGKKTIEACWSKDSFKKMMSDRMTGESNPFYGKKHSPETLDLIKSKLKGRVAWNKGVTKHNHPSMMKLSNDRRGSGNPMSKSKAKCLIPVQLSLEL